MYSVAVGMSQLAKELCVQIKTNAAVNQIRTDGRKVTGVETNQGFIPCDILVSGTDYHHTESLIPIENRQYSESY